MLEFLLSFQYMTLLLQRLEQTALSLLGIIYHLCCCRQRTHTFCSLFKYHISSAAVDDFTLKMMAAALMQIEFFNIRCR